MYSGKELINSARVLWVFSGKLNLASSSLCCSVTQSCLTLKPLEVQHSRLPCLTISWYGFLRSERFLQGSCHLSLFVIIDSWHQVFPLCEVHHHLGGVSFSETPVGWWGHCGSLHPWWDFSGKLEPRKFPSGTWCGLFVQGPHSPNHWPCLIGGGVSGEGKPWARYGAEQEVAGR